jgi:hypothetical protein
MEFTTTIQPRTTRHSLVRSATRMHSRAPLVTIRSPPFRVATCRQVMVPLRSALACWLSFVRSSFRLRQPSVACLRSVPPGWPARFRRLSTSDRCLLFQLAQLHRVLLQPLRFGTLCFACAQLINRLCAAWRSGPHLRACALGFLPSRLPAIRITPFCRLPSLPAVPRTGRA